MAKETIDFEITKKSLRLAIKCVKLINILDKITFGLFRERLRHQSKLVAALILQIKKE